MARVASLDVNLNGNNVDNTLLHGVTVEADIDQPDMATIVLNNVSGSTKFSETVNQGDSVEVKVKPTDSSPSGSGDTIFKGEVVGIEPHFDTGGESKVIIRAFNKLHRLTRGRKSKTWQNTTDSSIVNDIASANSLTASVNGDVSTQYEHVYQSNQTDLEFLLQRAARINYEIFVDDTTLNFRKRDVSQDSGITLQFGDSDGEYVLQRFSPRLSTAGLVQEVNVRAWKWDTNETIVGKATSLASKLGGTDGPARAQNPWPKVFYYDVDLPVATVEEANNIAKSKLEELAMHYITGEGVCMGNPGIKIGKVVTVQLGDGNTRFNGKYYIVGTTHRYQHKGHGGGSGTGYTTAIRVLRNADS